LDISRQLAEKVIKLMGKEQWQITASAERRDVLKDADYIINCIEVSGVECVQFDNDIPLKYGVDQCIGDTTGPGGLFKALRTVPVWLKVLKDVEELCPDAWILNYTNPMSIMCLAAMRSSSAKVLGLCHSIQGASHQLARWADLSFPEVTWKAAGINHMVWFTEYSHNGKDLYPKLRDRVLNEDGFLDHDPIRLDMMMNFGYYMTESSGHLSEYLPYYRKRPELIEKHCGKGYNGESGIYARTWPQGREERDKVALEYINGEREFSIGRSWEYASFIIQAMETNQPFVAYCSVPNTGLIDNLPQNGVVEVATLIDRCGAAPTYFGPLPAQCAGLCASNMSMFDLAANACIEKSKDLAAMALMLDPLTAAVCSPGEIRQMTDELFAAEKDFLPGFK